MIKRKGINLFHKKRNKDANTLLAENTVRYATFAGIGLFVVFLYFSISTLLIKTSIQSLLNEKQGLLTYLIESKNSETQTAYFLIKKEQLKTFLKDDATFLPYYNVLNNSLTIASNSAKVETMAIDKSRKTSFIFNFADYDMMYNFIRYVESEDFLKYFESLKLNALSLNKSDKNKSYQLTFEGKFKTLTQ